MEGSSKYFFLVTDKLKKSLDTTPHIYHNDGHSKNSTRVLILYRKKNVYIFIWKKNNTLEKIKF